MRFIFALLTFFVRTSAVLARSSPRNIDALSQLLFSLAPGVQWRSNVPSRTRFGSRSRKKLPAMQVSFNLPDYTVVHPKGCQSCEDKYLQEQKEREDEEESHLFGLNKSALLSEIWDYGETLNMTGAIMLKPDNEIRRFLLDSGSQLSPLMAKTYRATMERVPYETSWTICAPEQATALRTLTSMVQPRECLDIGSFTGLSSAAVLDALPIDAKITSLEINRNFSDFAAENLEGRNIEAISGNATESLRTLENNGRKFDFVVIDADYAMHEIYFNASIRLLRPGGVIVLFGMLFAPGVEGLHELLPTDERIKTAMLPLGCGLQVSVKIEGLATERPVTDSLRLERKRWQLDAEAAAIDRYLADLDHPETLKTELLEGPMKDPAPVTLISIFKQQREMMRQAEEEEAAFAEAAEAAS